MVLRPSGVVFVNNDLTDNVRSMLITQLHINDTIDGYVFDERVAADANYLPTIYRLNWRVMVVRSFEELDNRALSDVTIFVSNGLAAILDNKFGPPGQIFPVLDITLGKLCLF